jgi:predicted DNA-binding transcriptional regulator YafY
MSRNNQVTRILKVIHLLETNPRGYTAAELTSRLQDYGYSEQERTIRRDLEAVDQLFPLIQLPVEDGREKRYALDSVARVAKNVSFSVEELIALYLSRESMRSFSSSPLFQHVESFYNKLEKVLGAKAIEHLNEMKEVVHFKPIATWQAGVPQEIFDTVYRAAEEGHVVEVLYNSLSKVGHGGAAGGELSKRRLGPEGVYFGSGGAYLIAQDLGDGEIKRFSFSRIREAKWTDQIYESKGVDIKTYIDGGIGVLQMGETQDVEIFIKEPIASYVAERRWHSSQTVIRGQDGITLTLRVKVNDELARWVLSLGAHARVVKPSVLKSTVKEIAHLVISKD